MKTSETKKDENHGDNAVIENNRRKIMTISNGKLIPENQSSGNSSRNHPKLLKEIRFFDKITHF